MATRHSYVTTDDLRDYIAGTSYSSGWTSDAGILRRIIEASSLQIDRYVGMQSFGPRTETRYYDIGTGSLRDSRQNYVRSSSDSLINVADYLRQAIELDAWLVSTTTVTSYKATDRSSSETLTEGYNADFWLEPYNQNPKSVIKFNEDSTKSFYGGQQTVSILGTWGYSNDTTSETTADAIGSTSSTSISVSSASNLGIAQTILIDSEQLYITGISGNTLTVERGVNGTTAATHSGGASLYSYNYPELVQQACLDLGKVYFRDRDQGSQDIIGTGEMGVARSNQNARSILKTLDGYKAQTPSSMVVF